MKLERTKNDQLFVIAQDGDVHIGEFILSLDIRQALTDSFTWLGDREGGLIRIPHEALPLLIEALQLIQTVRNIQLELK